MWSRWRRAVRALMNSSISNKDAGSLRRWGEAGFSLLSTMLAVMILGIVLAIAVPRFSAAIAAANTVKVQADLTALDTAITLYRTTHGKNPESIDKLSDYMTDLAHLKPPSGKAQAEGKEVDLTGKSYALATVDSVCRAVCDGKTAEQYARKE